MMSFIIAIINVIVMFLSGFLFVLFYVLSVQPAKLEKRIGASAYKRCAMYRMVSAVMMCVTTASFIVYIFYPLPVPMPVVFPWKYYVNIIISIVIAIPSLYLFIKGMIDAGEETMNPKKEHALYKGIYEKIRHPQAVGEYFIWLIISFLLNSPFLIIVSLLILPPWIYMSFAEEKDLVVRYGKPYLEYKERTGMFFPKSKKQFR